MKKKIYVVIPLCVLLLTTACTDKRQEPEPTTISSGKESREAFSFDKEKIDSIIIEDSVKGYYDDEIRVELEPDEIADFVALVPELEIRGGLSGQGMSGAAYDIVCLDETGETLYTFSIDSSRNLNMEDAHLWHNDELVEYFKGLEDKYGLEPNENYDRNPGPKYFSQTDRIAKFEFDEFTETNFDEGVAYTYTAEEVAELRDGLSNAVISSDQTPSGEEYLYSISSFDKWGSFIYHIVVAPDNTVRINDRTVEYDSVKDWLMEMERVSGYVRE